MIVLRSNYNDLECLGHNNVAERYRTSTFEGINWYQPNPTRMHDYALVAREGVP